MPKRDNRGPGARRGAADDRLTLEQLDAVAAGYQIRETDDGRFEVVHESGKVVYTATTYGAAVDYCDLYRRRGG